MREERDTQQNDVTWKQTEWQTVTKQKTRVIMREEHDTQQNDVTWKQTEWQTITKQRTRVLRE